MVIKMSLVGYFTDAPHDLPVPRAVDFPVYESDTFFFTATSRTGLRDTVTIPINDSIQSIVKNACKDLTEIRDEQGHILQASSVIFAGTGYRITFDLASGIPDAEPTKMMVTSDSTGPVGNFTFPVGKQSHIDSVIWVLRSGEFLPYKVPGLITPQYQADTGVQIGWYASGYGYAIGESGLAVMYPLMQEFFGTSEPTPQPPDPTPGGEFPVSDNMPIFIFPTDKTDPNFTAGAVGTNLISAYNMSLANLQSFSSLLWGKTWVQDLKNFFTNPLDSIIRLIKLPITPQTDGLSWIYLGDFKMDTPGKYRHIQQQWVSFDLGKIEIARYFNNFMDFQPYTSISLFLPFLGFKDIDVDDVMGQTIRIVYQVDVLTGDFLAIVAAEYNDGANEVPLYQFDGNCAVEIPLGNSSLNIASAISSGLTAITLAGGVAGAVGSGVAAMGTSGAAVKHTSNSATASLSGSTSAIPGIISATEHKVSRSGALKGNMGYTANMYPYVVITRNIPDKPETYDSLIGKPSNYAVKLGTLSGYAEIEAIHVDQISATQEELNEIESLLLQGVIL